MNNKQLEVALEIATVAHKGVTRRNGDPYIFHPLRVCNNKTYIQNKLQKTAAILHDVVEDTPFTFQFLLEKGIAKEVIDVLAYLTHDKENVTYNDYTSSLIIAQRLSKRQTVGDIKISKHYQNQLNI